MIIRIIYIFVLSINIVIYNIYLASSLYSFSNTNWDHYSGYKTEISEKEYEEFLNPLIENDKIMVGVYMRIYNNDKLGIYKFPYNNLYQNISR